MIWKISPDANATPGNASTGALTSPPPLNSTPAKFPPLHDVSFTRKSDSPPSNATAGAAKPEGASTIPELAADELRRRAAAAKATTATFGEIVSVLMRSKEHRHYSLADIEQLVVPALSTGQVSVATAQSKTDGLVTPAAVLLWARVSEEVDRRLTAATGEKIRLTPKEWKSGDIVWVLLALGDQRILQGMIQQLQEKQWGRKPAKIFARSTEGKPIIALIGAKSP